VAKPVDWIKAHYDRVALVAAATFLFICAISIWWSAAQFGNKLAAQQQAAPAPKTASPPGKAVELDRAAEKFQQPPQWKFGGRSGLFVPEKHFIGANNLPATLQTTVVHPPVPNEWFEQFGLPVENADVLEEDPDSDGFTNFDEWKGQTNPTDKDSHPDFLTKLSLESATEELFRFMFSSWVGDTFAINTIDQSEPTQFLKKRDIIRGTRFKIVKFTEKYQPNQYGTNVDVSELRLEHEDTKEQLTLVKEKVAMSPESVATFAYSWGGRREFEVRKDQEFSLKPLEEIKYKLVDVQSNKAVIINIQKPNQPIEVGPAAP
jgi:hypothetical protein